MRLGSGLVLVAMFLAGAGIAVGQEPAEPNVYSCEQRTLARPNFGVSYRGTIRNSDYRFQVTIPKGLEGRGAAPSAPFHGFAIFIGDGACILLGVQMRVDLGDGDAKSVAPLVRTERVRIGNRTGQRSSSTGRVRGTMYENVFVGLQLPRDGYMNDLEVVLVTPGGEAPKSRALFEKFLASFRFW